MMISKDRGLSALVERLRAIPVPKTYEEWQAAVDRSYEGDAAAILGDDMAFVSVAEIEMLREASDFLHVMSSFNVMLDRVPFRKVEGDQ